MWSSRCAVCLLVAVGAALGPSGPLNLPGGTAHASSAAADGPSAGASPSETSGTSGTSGASSPATPVPALPSSTPSRSVSWSVPGSPSGTGPSFALPSGLPLPSGVPGSGAAEPDDGLSPDSMYVDGAEAPAGDGSPSPSRSASVEVSGSTAPLAGREAGAGKARPGRSLTPLELAQAEGRAEQEPAAEADEPDTAPAGLQDFTPPPDAFTDPAARAARALDAAAVRQVQQVSLGTGIALVGLGLAFLAFRLRRVN